MIIAVKRDSPVIVYSVSESVPLICVFFGINFEVHLSRCREDLKLLLQIRLEVRGFGNWALELPTGDKGLSGGRFRVNFSDTLFQSRMFHRNTREILEIRSPASKRRKIECRIRIQGKSTPSERRVVARRSKADWYETLLQIEFSQNATYTRARFIVPGTFVLLIKTNMIMWCTMQNQYK